MARKSVCQFIDHPSSRGQPLGLRGQAMAAFVASGDPGAATLFRQLLSSRSFELIPLAALGSGALKDVKAIDALEELMQAPSGAVRRAICLALVAIGTEKSLEGVARALLQAMTNWRRAAAEALANDPIEGHAMLKEGATLEDIMLRRAVVNGWRALSNHGQLNCCSTCKWKMTNGLSATLPLNTLNRCKK